MSKIKVVFLGQKPSSTLILKLLKKDKNLEILKIIEDKNSLHELKELKEKPEVAILANFGAILNEEILKIPKKGFLNIHPSLLPQYRGPSPVQTALLNNEQETGVTIFKMDNQVDHGPILAQGKEKIKPSDTSRSLYQKLFQIGTETLKNILPAYVEGRIELREQDHKKATFSKKFTKNDGKIDWQRDNIYLDRLIRAMFPWPGAWTEVKINNQTKRLKILKAHLEKNKLVIDQVQLEGKNPVSFKQFQEGHPQVKIIS